MPSSLAFACWANVRVRTYKLPIAAVAVLFGSSFVLAGIIPALFQRVYVKPNELQLERPYIQRNIASTQQAYNLHQITVEPFPAEQSLTAKTLEANKATIDNIRLWDWQPLMDTYGQMQEIRTYYKFHDVDIDRYWLDGTLSGGDAVGARAEILAAAAERPDLGQPPSALHPRQRRGDEPGHPQESRRAAALLSADIPPVATGGPEIREPRIYFGEETDSYVIVKGSTPEFDYPKGKDNVYAIYTGTRRHRRRRDRAESPVRLVLRRREHPALELHHRQPAGS